MGLDMFLEAKYKGQKSSGVRGACGGFIPLAPATENEEIGYWRKNYVLSEFLWEQLGITDKDNCVEFEMTEQDLLDAIDFCECCLEDNPNPRYDEDEWEYSIEIFKKALKLIKENDAKIYYMEWY